MKGTANELLLPSLSNAANDDDINRAGQRRRVDVFIVLRRRAERPSKVVHGAVVKVALKKREKREKLACLDAVHERFGDDPAAACRW